MAKYSPQELSSMAAKTLKAIQDGDDRGLQLLLTMTMRTGLDPNQIIYRLQGLLKP